VKDRARFRGLIAETKNDSEKGEGLRRFQKRPVAAAQEKNDRGFTA